MDRGGPGRDVFSFGRNLKGTKKEEQDDSMQIWIPGDGGQAEGSSRWEWRTALLLPSAVEFCLSMWARVGAGGRRGRRCLVELVRKLIKYWKEVAGVLPSTWAAGAQRGKKPESFLESGCRSLPVRESLLSLWADLGGNWKDGYS